MLNSSGVLVLHMTELVALIMMWSITPRIRAGTS